MVGVRLVRVMMRVSIPVSVWVRVRMAVAVLDDIIGRVPEAVLMGMCVGIRVSVRVREVVRMLLSRGDCSRGLGGQAMLLLQLSLPFRQCLLARLPLLANLLEFYRSCQHQATIIMTKAQRPRLTIRSALLAVRLHCDVGIKVVQRSVRLIAVLPATSVHALNLFIATSWAFVLCGAWDGNE
jgi:hypothetical protein